MNTMQIHKLCFLTLFLALFCSNVTFAVKFNFKSFDGNNLVFLGDAELGASSDGVGRSGAFSMTRDENPFSHGQGLYANSIPFKASNTSSAPYSFQTSFTFSISPRTKPISGHGLAFIVVPVADNSGASGSGFLGILNKTNNGSPENHLFAVEFDVFQDKSFGDINDNHVGLDVNSVNSFVAEKAGYWVQRIIGKSKLWSFKEVRLSNGEKYKAWIEYRNSKVTVTIAPENVEKPKRPLIEATRDLSQVFLQNMYTGFAGAMGRGVQRHDIWSWSFENSAKNN